jgi:hypothetical protein
MLPTSQDRAPESFTRKGVTYGGRFLKDSPSPYEHQHVSVRRPSADPARSAGNAEVSLQVGGERLVVSVKANDLRAFVFTGVQIYSTAGTYQESRPWTSEDTRAMREACISAGAETVREVRSSPKLSSFLFSN